MAFYGYDPGQFAKPYRAQGIEAFGAAIGKAVEQIPELSRLAKNEEKNEDLQSEFVKQASLLDDEVFTRAGQTKQGILAAIKNADLSKNNMELYADFATIWQPIQKANLSVQGKQRQAEIGAAATRPVAEYGQIGTPTEEGKFRLEPGPGTEGRTEYDQPITEITARQPTYGEAMFQATEAVPSATTKEVEQVPGVAAQKVAAEEELKRERLKFLREQEGRRTKEGQRRDRLKTFEADVKASKFQLMKDKQEETEGINTLEIIYQDIQDAEQLLNREMVLQDPKPDDPVFKRKKAALDDLKKTYKEAMKQWEKGRKLLQQEKPSPAEQTTPKSGQLGKYKWSVK